MAPPRDGWAWALSASHASCDPRPHRRLHETGSIWFKLALGDLRGEESVGMYVSYCWRRSLIYLVMYVLHRSLLLSHFTRPPPLPWGYEEQGKGLTHNQPLCPSRPTFPFRPHLPLGILIPHITSHHYYTLPVLFLLLHPR